jgi:hypothetical protein
MSIAVPARARRRWPYGAAAAVLIALPAAVLAVVVSSRSGRTHSSDSAKTSIGVEQAREKRTWPYPQDPPSPMRQSHHVPHG